MPMIDQFLLPVTHVKHTKRVKLVIQPEGCFREKERKGKAKGRDENIKQIRNKRRERDIERKKDLAIKVHRIKRDARQTLAHCA